MDKHRKLRLILVAGFVLQLIVCLGLVPIGLLLFLASQDGFTLGPGPGPGSAAAATDLR